MSLKSWHAKKWFQLCKWRKVLLEMLALYSTSIQEICFQSLDKNMLVLYFNSKYFNSDRDMDTLSAEIKMLLTWSYL